MGASKFEESLSIALYKGVRIAVDKLIGNNTELQSKSEQEINNFLNRVRKKSASLQAYLVSEFRNADKIIKSTTENFIFTYTIFRDKTSRIDVSAFNKYNRSYDSSFLESKVRIDAGYVYFIESDYGIKIGCTYRLTNRLNVFSVRLPFKIKLHSFIRVKDYSRLETTFHNLLKHKRLNGEWFDLSTEDFSEIDTLVANMKLKREFILSEGEL